MMIGSGGINVASALGQKNAYPGDYAVETTTAVEQTGLMRIADQITYATVRVDGIVNGLNQLAVGIHGPRPEPVSTEQGKVSHDNFSARVASLMDAIDRLQRSYESVVR